MRLPDSLLEEIKARDENVKPGGRRSYRPHTSRKEARKQQRLDRKKNNAEFHGIKKRPVVDEHSESPDRKRARQEELPTDEHKAPTAGIISSTNKKKKSITGGSHKTTRLATTSKAKSQIEEEEETYIAYLEAKLGYSSRGKKVRESEDDDGLGDLLDFADSVFAGEASAGSSLSNAGEWVEDANDNISDVSVEEEEVSSGEGDEGEDEGEDEDGSESSEDEWGGIEHSVNNGMDQHTPELSAGPDARTSTATTTYVPPHLRNAQQSKNQVSEVDTRLTKQLKGLLNRMSEQNLASILDGIEVIYRTYRRHDVTLTLTRLIINGITSHSSLLDSFVVLHAAFVCSLHRLIGVEFAAFFVQSLISDYDHYYAKVGTQIDAPDESIGKECSNLIVLLSELYNFQLIASLLVYDVIRSLLRDELTEFDVELLLKLLRNSGQQLRQDDPTALKDIIAIIQSKVSGKEGSLSSRTRFMIETLVNLKNNKLKRNATQNQGGDAVERMKKFLTSLGKKRHLHVHDALRVPLDDLRNAETKGKWWLVGAAWAGDPLVDKQTGARTQSADNSNKDDVGEQLLKLAKKQGMNTDIRRSIFVVVMSSDDYIDACERLPQLNLSQVQQREIVRVLLHCCGNEKTYNPYYALVCQHLCQMAHAYKITLQYCLWDFLRDLGESNVGGAEVIKNIKEDDDRFGVKSISKIRRRNVARAFGWWIAKDSVALTILKPVDFTTVKLQGREFLRELMINIFICSQVASPAIGLDVKNLPTTRNRAAVEEIFIKATHAEALGMGLVYFMTETFRDFSSQDEELTKLVKWASSVAKDTLRTGLDVVPMI